MGLGNIRDRINNNIPNGRLDSSSDMLLGIILGVGVGIIVIIILGVANGTGKRKGKGKDKQKGKEKQLPPGSVGLPLIGETLKLIAAYKSENPEPFIAERVRRHGGRLFTTHVFGERTVFSADPDFNRLLLCSEGRSVECSYPSSISTLLGRHSLLLIPAGPAHRRLPHPHPPRLPSRPPRPRPRPHRPPRRPHHRLLASWRQGPPP